MNWRIHHTTHAKIALTACLFIATSTSMHAQQKELLKAGADFSAAFVRGDTKAMTDFYTTDAVLMAPARDVIIGKDAILHYWESIPKNLAAHRCVADSIIFDGAEAHEYGNIFTTAKTGEHANIERSNTKYYIIWKKEGGTWKMKLDMWNSRLPATPR